MVYAQLLQITSIISLLFSPSQYCKCYYYYFSHGWTKKVKVGPYPLRNEVRIGESSGNNGNSNGDSSGNNNNPGNEGTNANPTPSTPWCPPSAKDQLGDSPTGERKNKDA